MKPVPADVHETPWQWVRRQVPARGDPLVGCPGQRAQKDEAAQPGENALRPMPRLHAPPASLIASSLHQTGSYL